MGVNGFKRALIFMTLIVGIGVLAGCATTSTIPLATTPKSSSTIKLSPQSPTIVDEKLLQDTKRAEESGNHVYKIISGIAEYIIGPGDVLEISLWEGSEEKKHTMTVRPDGNISISFLEDVHVGGFTASEADKVITERLTGFVKHPRVDVLIKEFNSKKAALFGEINILQTGTSGPGNYPLKGKTTVLDLVVTGGGATPDADLRRAKLVRGGKTYTLNLYKVMFQGEPSNNVILDKGDIVVIPESPTTQDKVFVLGEVNDPGAYSFKHEIDLVSAISLAGGYTVDAVEKNILIIRGYPDKSNVFVANLKDFLRKGDYTQNAPLQSGDVIYVPRSVIGDINYYVSRLTPGLDFLLFPAKYRDAYTTGGGLRINTGAPR